MTTIPSPIHVLADQGVMVIGPDCPYAPAEFHGRISWPEVTTPSGDPRRWLTDSAHAGSDDHAHIQMLGGMWGEFWGSDEDAADNPL